MFNIHLIFANESHKDLSQLFIFMIRVLENRKFCCYYFLREFVLAKKGTFKVGDIGEFGNMTFTVFIFTTATSEFAYKRQLPTALFQNFYYLVPSDPTDLLYLYNRIQTRRTPL